VISDHHEGLKNAIARVLDAPWQRCTVHYADSRVMPSRVRSSCSGRVRARFCRHNHSASRNARTRSVGW
jgi:transposase-like protein